MHKKCGRIRDEQHNLIDGICKICNHGVFIDSRDGNKYLVIKIGDQIMMAENLRYNVPGGSYAYGDSNVNAKKYGLLYTLEAAKEVTKGLSGWHLPSKNEWIKLNNYIDGRSLMVGCINYENYGFNPLYGGYLSKGLGLYTHIGHSAYFWSSSAFDDYKDCIMNLGGLFHNGNIFNIDSYDPCYSVRFFRD